MGKRSERLRARKKYLADLGLRPPTGSYCPRCGERVFVVVSPAGTKFMVTTRQGKAKCVAG